MAGVLEMSTLLWKSEFDNKKLDLGVKSASNQISEMQNKFGGLSNFLGKTVLGGVLGISGGLAGMATAGVKAAMDLQDSMSKFQASTGVSDDEVKKIEGTIKGLYKTSQESYSDIADMATAMSNNMQMNSADIQKYGQTYLDYAKITKQSSTDVVGAADDIGDAWGLNNDKIVGVMNQLVASQQMYGLSVQDSQSAVKALAPAFQGLKMNITDAISYLNLFADNGIDAGTSVTAFNYALKKVKSPAELQKMVSDIQNTKDATERAHKAVELFGARAGVQMANALKPGTQSISDYKASISDVGFTIDEASKKYNGSLKVQLDLAKRQVTALLEQVGEKLTPYIKQFVDYLQSNMPSIEQTITKTFSVAGTLLDALGKGIQFCANNSNILLPLLAGFIASMGALKVIGVVNGLMTIWKASTFAQTLAQSGLNAAMLANPIGLVVAAIGVLVAIGVVLWKNWDVISAKAKELWGNISKFFGGIGDSIKGTWNAVTSKTSETWNNLKSATSQAWQNISDKVKEHGGGIKGVIGTYIEVYKDVWNKGFSALNTLTGGKLGDVINSVKNKLSSIHDTISGWKQKLADAWSKIWDLKLPHIDMPHFSISGKFSINPPQVPTVGIKWYGQGGIFNSPQIVGVGESGTEAVVPLDKLSDILYNTMQKLDYSNNKNTGSIENRTTHNYYIDVGEVKTNDASQFVTNLKNLAYKK